MSLPNELSQDEIKSLIRLQHNIVATHKVAESDKNLVLPSIRGLSNDDLVDILEWYSDRVKLFHPSEPLFDDHSPLELSAQAFYVQADRDSAYCILTDSHQTNAVVLQAEASNWEWHCIGIFSSKSTVTLLESKFSKYDDFKAAWQEDPSDISGDSELSDYWNLYDNDDQDDDDDDLESSRYDTLKASEITLGELDIRIHREIHALWKLYSGCGLEYTSFVSDLAVAIGDNSLASTVSDGPLHSYTTVSIPNFIRMAETSGFPVNSVENAILDCLKSIDAKTNELLPSGFNT